jgi:iron complex outermembrane receptor protein
MISFRILLFSGILLAFTGGAAAQAVVSGRVTDSQTGEPLTGVYVIWGRGLGTATDTTGSFSFSTGEGTVTIDFRFIGYRSRTETLSVTAGVTAVLDIELDPEAQFLDQVVVSADRMEQKRSDLTVTMDVIRSESLYRTHITDAQELITKTPGIEVLDGQASIRGGSGFSYGVGSRVLALVDGLPMMSADAGNIKWQFLPLENLAQVEIIKGASSVLYGSSALNGVINFRTADASNVPVTTFYSEAGLFGSPANTDWKWWDTPRLYGSASFSHLRKIGNTDLGLGVNLSSDRGYRKYNDESLGRVSLRLKHHSSKYEGLKYGINLSGGKTYKIDFVLWEDALTGGLKQDTSTVSRLHGYTFSADPYISIGKRGKYRHDIRMRLQASENRFPVRIANNAGSVSLYGEYQFWYAFNDQISLTAGFSETWSAITSNFFGDHRGLNLAGFAQAEVRPVERLKITGGLRLEQNILDNVADGLVPVFRAGLNFQAARYTFLRTSFGQGYRYPSIAEKHASTTLGSVRIFPSPSVRPESGWSSEAGVMQGFMIGQVRGEGDLSVFLSQSRDMIEYIFGLHQDPGSGFSGLGFKATNIERSRIFGTETELMLSRPVGKMTAIVTGGYTFINPVELNPLTGQGTGKYLKYRRKHTAKISLLATGDRFQAGVDLYARSKTLNIDRVFLEEDSRDDILPGFYDYWQEHNTGYFLMDGNIGYSLNRSLKLSAAVKNITNTEYMGRPGDIQPHRNISLRFSGKF